MSVCILACSSQIDKKAANQNVMKGCTSGHRVLEIRTYLQIFNDYNTDI